MSDTVREWRCQKCATRLIGHFPQSEAAIAWMALWHMERAHLGLEPTEAT